VVDTKQDDLLSSKVYFLGTAKIPSS